MDEILKSINSLFDWLEHHGTIFAGLTLFTGSVGAYFVARFENRLMIRLDKTTVNVTPAEADEIKIFVNDKQTSSLAVTTISISNVGRKDLEDPIPLTIKTRKGTLLACKPSSASTGIIWETPNIDAGASETCFDVPRLKRGEHIRFQVYTDAASPSEIDVIARPIHVDVKSRDFEQAVSSTKAMRIELVPPPPGLAMAVVLLAVILAVVLAARLASSPPGPATLSVVIVALLSALGLVFLALLLWHSRTSKK